MKDDKVIFLVLEHVIGEGGNQKVYINPENAKQCIKINIAGLNDHRREMAYRKSRKFRKLPPSSLLVEYFGEVKTNLGTGYVYERAADYDGSTSRTFEELILLEQKARETGRDVGEMLKTEKKIPGFAEVLYAFRKTLFKEIIIPDMGVFNYVVQFDSPTEWRVRIVDDIGSPTLIPIVYYIDYFAAGHVRRRWVRFIKEIMELYPGFLSDKECTELMKV